LNLSYVSSFTRENKLLIKQDKFMTTLVNNPRDGKKLDSGVSMIVGVIILLMAIGLFFVYGLSTVNNKASSQSDSTNVNADSPTGLASSLPALAS